MTVATSPFAQRLASRRAELRELLHAAASAAVHASDRPADVIDLKDVAADDARNVVDEAALDHATAELHLVDAALRRMQDGSYGQCLDCGEAIAERRLEALPASPYCTACQAIHERSAGQRR